MISAEEFWLQLFDNTFCCRVWIELTWDDYSNIWQHKRTSIYIRVSTSITWRSGENRMWNTPLNPRCHQPSSKRLLLYTTSRTFLFSMSRLIPMVIESYSRQRAGSVLWHIATCPQSRRWHLQGYNTDKIGHTPSVKLLNITSNRTAKFCPGRQFVWNICLFFPFSLLSPHGLAALLTWWLTSDYLVPQFK